MRKSLLLMYAILLHGLCNAQVIPNAGMETWRNNNVGSSPVVAIHAPVEWYGVDSLVISNEEVLMPLLMMGYHPSDLHAQVYEENTVVNSGSASAKLITLKQDTIGRIPGLLSNAKVGINAFAIIGGAPITSAITFSGGTPVTLRIKTVSAYVKYLPGKDSITGLFGGIDTGLLTVQAVGHLHGHDTVVGTGVQKILPASSFTQITANIAYWDTTYTIDSIRIVFASSGGGVTSFLDSSILYVDDLTMSGVPNEDHSMVPQVAANDAVKVYPNPAGNVIYLKGPKNMGYKCDLFSADGKVMISKILNGNDVMDIALLPGGLYLFTIRDAAGDIIQRGKVVVSR